MVERVQVLNEGLIAVESGMKRMCVQVTPLLTSPPELMSIIPIFVRDETSIVLSIVNMLLLNLVVGRNVHHVSSLHINLVA